MFTKINGRHCWNETFINNINDIGDLCKNYYQQDDQGITIFKISEMPHKLHCEYMLLKSRVWKPTKWSKFSGPSNCRYCDKLIKHIPAWDITGHTIWTYEDRETYDEEDYCIYVKIVSIHQIIFLIMVK